MASQLVTIQIGGDVDGMIPHEATSARGDLRQEVAEGLFYTHMRLSQNTNRALETAAFLYGLIELLSEKGLFSIEELDEHKRVMGERLTAQLKEKGLGVMLQDSEDDKYSFPSEVQIDC